MSKRSLELRCDVCGRKFTMQNIVPAAFVRSPVTDLVRQVQPSWGEQSHICYADLNRFRSEYVQRSLEEKRGELSELEQQVVQSLLEHELLAENLNAEFDQRITIAERVADTVAQGGGSWKFIIGFGAVLVSWIAVNSVGLIRSPFDPYPVFANIQKFTTYVLASNVPEILPYLMYVVFPVPLALSVIQILSIDLGTDLIPAIGLGQEPPERDTLQRPPRKYHERLLTLRLMLTSYLFLGLIQGVYSLALFFLVLMQGGWRWGQELAESDPLYRSATGIALATIILMQIGNVISRRSTSTLGIDLGLFRNRLILLGIAIEVAFSWTILYWEPVQSLLRTGPVSSAVYALAWGGIPLLLFCDRARKAAMSRKNRSATGDGL